MFSPLSLFVSAHINNSDIIVTSKSPTLITMFNDNDEGNSKNPPSLPCLSDTNPNLKVKTTFPPRPFPTNPTQKCDNDKPSSGQPSLQLNTTFLGLSANLVVRNMSLPSSNPNETHSGRQISLDHNTKPMLPCTTSNGGLATYGQTIWMYTMLKIMTRGSQVSLTPKMINMKVLFMSQYLSFLPSKIPGILEWGPIFSQSYGAPLPPMTTPTIPHLLHLSSSMGTLEKIHLAALF